MIRALRTAGLCLAFLLVLELLARAYVTARSPANYADLSAIPTRAQDEEKALTWTWNERGYWRTDSTEPWIHVNDNGERRTVGQINALRTVWLIGSSVMQGVWVRDRDTIASYLQARLPHYRVVNMASPGQVAANMLRQVDDLALKPGDVVIEEGVSMDATGVINLTRLRTSCAPFGLVQLVCQPRPDDVLNATVAEQTLAAVRRTRDKVTARGAVFRYVIMPYFYAGPLTDRQQAIDAHTAPETVAIYRSAWLALYDRLTHEPYTLELSGAIDGGDFVDLEHFGAPGNAAVARAVWEAVWRAF